MKIVNRTRFVTADLRRFFLAGLEALGAETDKTIRVVEARRHRACGEATLGGLRPDSQGRWIRISLVPAEIERHDVADLARVFEHEVAHSLGLQHGDMDPALRDCSQATPAWALPFTVLSGEIRTKPTAATLSSEERAARRIAAAEKHAIRMSLRWRRKLAMARRQFARWTRKVRYYERRAGAIAAGAAERKERP